MLLSKTKYIKDEIQIFHHGKTMNNEQRIIEKFGREPGFKAPDDFLERIYTQIAEERGDLPSYENKQEKVTRWHRIRPYIYLAAMFAGIWCMMKMFDLASEHGKVQAPIALTEKTVSLDNPPEMLAEAAVTPEITKELQLSEEIHDPASTDYELEQDMQASYTDFNDFEEAFDYEFDQQYADMNVDDIVAEAEFTEAASEE